MLKKLSWTSQLRSTGPFRTNTQKRCPVHYRGLECRSRKSRNTWSNRQIWPWNTEWSRAKTDRVLPRKCTCHNKHPLPTTQEKTLYMDITRWSTPKSDWLYSLIQRWRSSIQSAKTRPGADCGSDHELLTAKFRLKSKKVGKTTRPFRYDLNQILYDYTDIKSGFFCWTDLELLFKLEFTRKPSDNSRRRITSLNKFWWNNAFPASFV